MRQRTPGSNPESSWRGMPFYGPTDEELSPPRRPSIARRIAAFAADRVESALVFLLCLDAILAATRGVA